VPGHKLHGGEDCYVNDLHINGIYVRMKVAQDYWK